MAIFFDPTELNSGNWAGAGKSGGQSNPSFVPYTAYDIAVPPASVGGIESGFDLVSKNHDIDYAAAQSQLVIDLANLVNPHFQVQRLSYSLVAVAA